MKNLLLLCFFLISTILNAQDIDIEPFATGLNKPVNLQNAGDDRLFVVELDGYIRILDADGNLFSTPFLDIDDKVVNISGLNERGFLGLAFHPDYESNGYLYVNYINNDDNTVISRFTRQSENLADPDSELVLLTINQPFGNHNGGNLAFSKDGFLYIATGDGGSGGDPQDNGQDLSNLLGKILRIDINNTNGSLNYAIPSSNPFISTSGARDEIWAYGLRNPWKFSFDRQTFELWIGDVGQNFIEEVNVIGAEEAGINFGWRCYEGSRQFNLDDCPAASSLTFPVGEYLHTASRRSITGGYRYRGAQFPTMQGLYFFADYLSSEIGTVTQNGPNYFLDFKKSFPGNGWSTFGENNEGELFIVSANSGNIFQVVDRATLSDEEKLHGKITILPNPVIDLLTIDFSAAPLDAVIRIYDLTGREVFMQNTASEIRTDVNLEHLVTGIYILNIEKNESILLTKKLIKN